MSNENYERYGMDRVEADDIPEEGREAAIKHMVEQVMKIPAGDFEIFILCAKIKDVDSPLIAFGGNGLELTIGLSVLVDEAKKRGILD